MLLKYFFNFFNIIHLGLYQKTAFEIDFRLWEVPKIDNDDDYDIDDDINDDIDDSDDYDVFS